MVNGVYPFVRIIFVLLRMRQYSTSMPGLSLDFRLSSSGNGASRTSYVSRSIIWAAAGRTAMTCPLLFSIIGTSALASTGFTKLLLTLSKTPIATTLAFVEPCFPGFDFVRSTMRPGSLSMIT